MKTLFKKYFIITSVLFFLTHIISSIKVSGSWNDYLFASLILGVLYSIVRPIANIILLPLNILTLNLSSWLLTILIFFVWSQITPHVIVGPWNFPGISLGPLILTKAILPTWEVILISGILLTLISKGLSWLLQ